MYYGEGAVGRLGFASLKVPVAKLLGYNPDEGQKEEGLWHSLREVRVGRFHVCVVWAAWFLDCPGLVFQLSDQSMDTSFGLMPRCLAHSDTGLRFMKSHHRSSSCQFPVHGSF